MTMKSTSIKVTRLFAIFSGITLAQNSQKPNILFIAVDDLKPELGCYGQAQIKSTNIDKLAETGLIFNRTYCNVPVCGASRAGLLSGVRPNRYRFASAHICQDEELPGVVSLPMHLKITDIIRFRWAQGETVVTQTHPYTEWFDDNTGEKTARMLYDLTKDPEENVNISKKKENKKLAAELSAKIKACIMQRDKIALP